MAGNWSLSLHCAPFIGADGNESSTVTPLAIVRSGNTPFNAFGNDSTIVVYDRDTFEDDLGHGAEYNAVSETGTWTWDRLKYDIVVEAQAGSKITSEPYTSVFTWTLGLTP